MDEILIQSFPLYHFSYFIFKCVGVLKGMIFELLFGRKKKKSQNKIHPALQLPVSYPLTVYLGA